MGSRAMWNQFVANQYVGPEIDWIVILDPDAIFFSPFIPDLLFDWNGPEPRPIVFGVWQFQFSLGPVSVGMEWVANFMDSYPNVVRPRHILAFQNWLITQTEA